MIFTKDNNVASIVNKIRFFGFNSNKDIVLDGTNGKMSELNAALGLCCLDDVDRIIKKRKAVFKEYQSLINQGCSISTQKIHFSESNCSYFPIILENGDIITIAFSF